MEPMVTISVKDYNALVRSCGNKHVVELLKVIVEYLTKDQGASFGRGYYNVLETLQTFIKQLQSDKFSFEEVMEHFKNDLHHESTEENKEGSEVR